MQRRGGSGQPVKGQSVNRPKAHKAPTAQVSAADLQEQLDRRTRERDEALEQQTATSEILGVIRRSPTNAQPVFDAIVESASRLCKAVFSVVWRYDGDLIHYAASHNFTPEVLDHIFKTYPKRPDRSVAAGRAILDGTIAHVPDMLADPGYAHELALAGNWRASIAVPMLRDAHELSGPLARCWRYGSETELKAIPVAGLRRPILPHPPVVRLSPNGQRLTPDTRGGFHER